MKNYWLDKNPVIIEQQLAVPRSFSCYGKWYVCKKVDPSKYKYLHKDGLWWSGAADNGYYDTRKDAEEAYAKSLA